MKNLYLEAQVQSTEQAYIIATMRIVITGGHHSSALPVIEELKKLMPEVQLFWFGHKYSLKGDKNPTFEYHEITKLGIPFYDIKAGKFYKTFNLLRLAKIPYGFFQSLYFLIKLQPQLIVSFGGYLAVPVVLAGKILGIPSVTHEQTVVVGYANKVISKFASKILISWPQSQKYFDPSKTILTGIPVRKDIFEVRSNAFKLNPDLPTVYITAGKTGSVTVNEAIQQALEFLLGKVNIIHQCGDHSEFRHFDVLTSAYERIKNNVPGIFHLRKFVYGDEIGEAYKKSDFILGRAGAHVISELIAWEKPCILVPIPWVSHNEQNKNAEMLRDAGLGIIVSEKNIKEELPGAVEKMSKEYNRYTLNDENLKKLIRMDSAVLIAHEIHDLLKNEHK